MPSVACKPQAEGTWRGWSLLSGDSLGFRCVDDSDGTDHDSAATFLRLPKLIPGVAGRVSFPFFLQWAGGLPSLVTVNIVAQRGGASHPRLQIGFLRGSSIAFSGTFFDPGVSWQLATFAFATDPITGLSWDPEDMPVTEVCVQNETNVFGNNDVTLISASVDYTEPHNYDPIFPRSASLE